MSLQHALLGLLSYRPMTGYDLKQIFEKSINHFWSAQLSQIYRDLGNLETKGYLTSRIEPQEGRPDKKVYSITAEGEKAFHNWLVKFPQALTCAVRDEFLVRIFFGSQLPPGELEFQLKKFIKEKQEEIESYSAVEKIIEHYAREMSRSEEKLFWRLTLRRGYIMAEGSIRWAEECLEQLKKAGVPESNA